MPGRACDSWRSSGLGKASRRLSITSWDARVQRSAVRRLSDGFWAQTRTGSRAPKTLGGRVWKQEKGPKGRAARASTCLAALWLVRGGLGAAGWRPGGEALPTWARASTTRPEPAGRAARAAEGRRGRAEGRGRGRGLWLSRGVERGPETLAGSGRRCHRSSGHEDPVDGAVRVGTTVAWGSSWLRRGRALLPWSGPSLLRPRLEAGQGLRNVLLRSSLPSHRGLLLRLRPGVSRWVAGPGVGPPTVQPQTSGRGQGAGPLEVGRESSDCF